jgi:hypothetical protein
MALSIDEEIDAVVGRVSSPLHLHPRRGSSVRAVPRRPLAPRRPDPHRTPSARGEASTCGDVDDDEIVRILGITPPVAEPRPEALHVDIRPTN